MKEEFPQRMSEQFLFNSGEKVHPRYRIIRPVAKGGLGEVYEVESIPFGGHLILKVERSIEHLRRDGLSTNIYDLATMSSPENRAMSQFRTMMQLNHPNILKVFEPLPSLPHDTAGLILENIENAITLEEMMADMPDQWDVIGFGTGREFDREGRLRMLIDKYGSSVKAFCSTHSEDVNRQNPKNDDIARNFVEGYNFTSKYSANVEPGSLHALRVQDDSLRFFLDVLNKKYTDLFVQLEMAIEHIQQRGIIHRDIRGPNVLIDSYILLKVIDMGLASNIGEALPEMAARSVMTPESTQGILDISYDSLGLGILTFKAAFKGHHPFHLSNDSRTIARKIQQMGEDSANFEDDDIIIPFSLSDFYKVFSHMAEYFESPRDKSKKLSGFLQDTMPAFSTRASSQYSYDPVSNSMKSFRQEECERPRLQRVFRWLSYLNINPKTRLYFRENPIAQHPRKLEKEFDIREVTNDDRNYTILRPKAA